MSADGLKLEFEMLVEDGRKWVPLEEYQKARAACESMAKRIAQMQWGEDKRSREGHVRAILREHGVDR